MSSVPASELLPLSEKLFQVRTELLDLADSEVHVGYAAAYRATARQVTKLIGRMEILHKAAVAGQQVPEQESIPGVHTG